MALEGYDLVMLGILAAAAVLGYFKGMVWQVAWIAGIAASSFVALRFGSALAPSIPQPAPWNRLIAMLALYVATSLVVWLLFRVVSGAINAVHLSAFDKQLGLLLGLAKGALLCIVITFFSVTLAPAYRHQIVGSHSGRLVAEIIVRADDLLPREIGEAVDPFVKQFEEQFREGHVPAADAATVAAQPGPAALWDAVGSATAWSGTGGGQGSVPQRVSAWGGMPTAPATAPGSAPVIPSSEPASWNQPPSIPPPAGQRTPAAALPQAWPEAPPPVGFRAAPANAAPAPLALPQNTYPIGAQTPLQRR